MTEKQCKAFKKAMAEELKNRLELMRKRQAYFSAVDDEYESLDEFTNTQKEWLEYWELDSTKRVLHNFLSAFNLIIQIMRPTI